MNPTADSVDNRSPFTWRAFRFVGPRFEEGLFLPWGWNLEGLVIQSVATSKHSVIPYAALRHTPIVF